MKTLTALILPLASLSVVHASEVETSTPVAIQLPTTETIAIAFADDALPSTGECKAVCMLPGSID
jgi:hypothetical protein